MLVLACLSLLAQDPELPYRAVPHPSLPAVLDGDPYPWWALAPSWWNPEAPQQPLEDGVYAVQAYLDKELPGLVPLGALTPPSLRLRYRWSREGANEPLLAGYEPVRLGTPLRIADVRRRRVVGSFDVEIAQSAAIADPVEADLWSGASLALQLTPVLGRGYQVEFALVESEELAAEPMPANFSHNAFHGYERLRSRVCEAGATLLLAGAQPRGALLLPGPDGATYQLDLALEGAGVPQALALPQQHWLVAVPGLTATPEAAYEAQRAAGEAYAWSSREGWMVLAGPQAEAAVGRLSALAQARSASRRLELQAGLERASGSLTLGRVQVDLLEGAPLQFASGVWRQALTSWDVEVAQDSRIPDPEFEALLSGWQGSVRWIGEEIEMELDLTAVRAGTEQTLLLGSERPISDGRSMPMERVKIERPEQDRVGFRGRFQPDADGVIRLERSVRHFDGEPGTVRVEIRLSPRP